MSSDDLAIKVENIAKCYRLGVKEKSHETFGAAALDFIRSPVSNFQKYRSLYKFDDAEQDNEDILWALRDVSFTVKQGEVLGIIGTNGAGKSTLLKILSKITPPSKGRAEIHGRVSSLLEVGTGFHQELTGRENVYLNGTILGMRKKEIDANFDEIVDFSGVEKFLDTPVKRYSSGMRVRLAFAVAAYLEPEILIIDEVLAVGDAAFQKKCLNKMQDVSSTGRTVLFVSHSMPSITRLCSRSIVLNAGTKIFDGTPQEAVSVYLHSGYGASGTKEWQDRDDAPGDEVVRLRALRVKTSEGDVKEGVDIRKPVAIEMEFDVLEEGHVLMPYYDISNDEGVKAFAAIEQDEAWRDVKRKVGRYVSKAWIPGNLLSEGTLYISAAMRTTDRRKRRFHERDIIAFQVMDTMEGDSARGEWSGRLDGAVRPLLDWETEHFPLD